MFCNERFKTETITIRIIRNVKEITQVDGYSIGYQPKKKK